jgi:hypothetical protein
VSSEVFGTEYDGVPMTDLRQGDVIAFRRLWHPEEGVVAAVVVRIVAEGPVIDGPTFNAPSLARTGVVEARFDHDELLGLDDRGRYHLYSEDREEIEVRTPEDEYYSQRLAPFDLGRWIRHVEDSIGWDELAARYSDALDGGESA